MKASSIVIAFFLGLVLSQGDLVFGEECGGYQTYLVSADYLNLELAKSIGLNTKKDAKYTLQTDQIGTRTRCNNVTVGTTEFVYTKELVLPYKDPKGHILNFVAPLSANPISGTVDETLNEVFRLVRYPGYIGNVWTGYSKTEKEILINNPLGVIFSSYDNNSQTCPTGAILEKEEHRMNCVIDGLAIDDFFLNDISYNWALWLMVFYLLSFFFVALCFNETVPIDYAAESNWTLHPCVSINTRGSEIYTKQSRYAQYFLFMASLSFFTAVMHLRWWEEHLAIRLLVFPVFGTFFGLIITSVTGILLNITYKVHWEFINGYKLAENHEMKKHNLDNYERRLFKSTYIFYILLMFAIANFAIWPIWFMEDLPLVVQGYWIVGIIIGVAFDLLLWRMIMVFLARAESLKKMFKVYGFYYDAKMHDEYAAIVGYKM